MKKILLLFLLGFTVAFGQTNVSGLQSGVWTKTNSPYNVTGDILVPQNDTLTVESGVEVVFQGPYKIKVKGILMALGREGDTVYFTATDTLEGWRGIRLDTASGKSVLRYCKFSYGKAVDSDFPAMHGGAFFSSQTDFEISHCVFENNSALNDNGGTGGAIYAMNTTDESRISNCVFRRNYAYGEGGAIKLTGDNGLKIDSSYFYGNSVRYGGGAITIYGGYNTTLFRCLFYNNRTLYSNGGAVLVEFYSSDVKVQNCTFVQNAAPNGDGGAIQITNSDVFIVNSVLTGNEAAYSGDINVSTGNVLLAYSNSPVPDYVDTLRVITTDPLFVSPDSLDFSLQETSPCIDAGIDTLVIYDQNNNPHTVIVLDSSQFYGEKPDMGAFEFNPNPNPNPTGKQIGLTAEIYPVPASDLVMIRSQQHINFVEVFDMTGHRIAAFDKPVFDVKSLNPGVYFLKIYTSEGIFRSKFVKK